MANDRHTMFFMGKEYPNVAMGGGSGGGGGSSIEKLAEYDGTGKGYPAGSTITLSDSISNYDLLMFTSVYQTGTEGFSNSIVTVEDFKTRYTTRFYHEYNPAGYGDLKYIDDTTISVLRAQAILTYSVYGIKISAGGGGDTPSDEGIILFDGTWKNQNILGITPYLATIENGELHCQGLHCGVVVSDVSGMTSDYNPYQLIITGYSQGFGLQAGRCNPTNDLNGIIQYGTNRLSYTNDTIPLGNFKIRLNTLNNLQGVFLGGEYTVASTDFTITKILLSRQNTEKTYS